MLTVLTHNPIFRGIVAGVGAAAVVDVHAFLAWKQAHDFVTYDWGTAILRWLQGAVTGAIAGAGFGAIS